MQCVLMLLIYNTACQNQNPAELKKENYKYECLCMHTHCIPLGYLTFEISNLQDFQEHITSICHKISYKLSLYT